MCGGMPSHPLNTQLLSFCRPIGKLHEYSDLSDMTRKIKYETFTFVETNERCSHVLFRSTTCHLASVNTIILGAWQLVSK